MLLATPSRRWCLLGSAPCRPVTNNKPRQPRSSRKTVGCLVDRHGFDGRAEVAAGCLLVLLTRPLRPQAQVDRTHAHTAAPTRMSPPRTRTPSPPRPEAGRRRLHDMKPGAVTALPPRSRTHPPLSNLQDTPPQPQVFYAARCRGELKNEARAFNFATSCG